jgi:hypothetical protein
VIDQSLVWVEELSAIGLWLVGAPWLSLGLGLGNYSVPFVCGLILLGSSE